MEIQWRIEVLWLHTNKSPAIIDIVHRSDVCGYLIICNIIRVIIYVSHYCSYISQHFFFDQRRMKRWYCKTISLICFRIITALYQLIVFTSWISSTLNMLQSCTILNIYFDTKKPLTIVSTVTSQWAESLSNSVATNSRTESLQFFTDSAVLLLSLSQTKY